MPCFSCDHSRIFVWKAELQDYNPSNFGKTLIKKTGIREIDEAVNFIEFNYDDYEHIEKLVAIIGHRPRGQVSERYQEFILLKGIENIRRFITDYRDE